MKDDLLRQRRNLISISIGLIILDLGVGTFNPDGSLFGGSIHFEKTFILTATLWFAFSYFIWRFWIFGGNKFITRMREDYMDYVCSDPYFNKTLNKKLSNKVYQQVKARNPNTVNLTISRPSISWKWIEKSKDIEMNCQFSVSSEKINLNFNEKINFEASKYIDVFIRSFIKAIFSKRAFSDYALPLIFALTAALLGIF